MATLNFDATNVPPNEFTPLPAGEYLCIMSASEFKENKAKTGSFLECTFKVVSGKMKDRTVKSRLNLMNQSEEAVRIAKGDLSSICRAVGIMQPKDSTQLHNIPLVVIVACTNPDGDGRVFNEVKGYRKRDIEAAPEAAAPVASPASGAGKPAWMGAGA